MFGIAKNNSNSFKELAYPHMRFLFNVALKYMHNQYDAEDLVQETMYAAFRNFHQLRDHSKCRSWLFAILRSNFLKEKRQAVRRPYLGTDESYLNFLEGVSVSNLAGDFEKKLESEHIKEVIERLPEKYKTPLILFFLEDMSYQEIAELLDIPIGTVMSRLSRAKQSMKKELLREATLNESKIVEMSRKAARRQS
ncbi:MAG: sigma-70 family RNA polymerase sigma factor [Thermodesulfobacteriota bacterium]